MNATISVLVPVYNVENYIEKCVKSIMEQSYRNLEIVLVDDGSTDASGKICDDFAKQDKRIKVIHQKNSGLVAARKAALAYATGEYCMNVDGDDWIDAEMAETLMAVMQKQNVDVVQCNYVCEGGKTPLGMQEDFVLDISSMSKKNEVLEEWMTGGGVIYSTQINKLFKTDFYRLCYSAVPVERSLGEDQIAFLHIVYNAKKLAGIARSFYHYVRHSGSISYGRQGVDMLIQQTAFITTIYETIKKLYPTFSQNLLDRHAIRLLIPFLEFNGPVISIYQLKDIKQFFGKRLCLYGAGRVGIDLYADLCKYKEINVVAWCDKNASNFNFDYCKVKPVEELEQIDFDYIFIAVLKQKVAEEITEELVQRGIERHKIIWQEPVARF